MPENGKCEEETVEYACVFCRSGSEEQLAREIEERYPFLDALCAMKVRYRHVNGKPVEEKVVLFPGYLFLRLERNQNPFQLSRGGSIYRILKSQDDNWKLTGSDRAFAEELFENGGVFGISQAFYENDRIQIVNGPLKAYNGRILRVNHRKRTAQVVMSVQGLEMNVWLGFELIEKQI